MLIAVSHRERDYDIEDNGPGKARYALAPYEKGGGKDYDIAAEILADVEILEFQREHFQLAHHKQLFVEPVHASYNDLRIVPRAGGSGIYMVRMA